MSFFGTGNANHATKYFDIRLDSPYVVFRGGESEAASAHLKGSVVCCVTEPLTVKHFRLTLNGISRVGWYLPSANSVGGLRKTWKERTFFEHTWSFVDPGKGKTEHLKPDNYEFPFDIVLEGTLPESVEGLHDTWVIYRFKAEIGRKYSKDIVVRKPLRIIRTLDPSNLELSHAMSVENIWPNKIEYSISTPSKAVVFGTSVRVDFRLIPLLKGLRIGTISSQVIESHDFTLDPDVVQSYSNNYRHTKVVATDEYVMDESADPQILDEEAEGYQLTRQLELPKTLNKCLQDTDTRGIKVRHKLKFNVQLHNPDGHTSELRATLPIALFVSPAIAINENNDLVDQTPTSSSQRSRPQRVSDARQF
ncbi:putative carbon catabolite repression protein [Phaeomoniella chlamydospora]|uniref:Carbon catabolite repressor D n=1 Tax=Phaeomoniella chlamydospora TaxID=158046 RepID=A0A0G2E450_PHACM|nr:putative carbon catabolite repression protein [Phaeomoniella chlamydospora]